MNIQRLINSGQMEGLCWVNLGLYLCHGSWCDGVLSDLAIILGGCFTLIVLWPSVFCVSSSWYRGLVCSINYYTKGLF